jgi:hypothetical protein
MEATGSVGLELIGTAFVFKEAQPVEFTTLNA